MAGSGSMPSRNPIGRMTGRVGIDGPVGRPARWRGFLPPVVAVAVVVGATKLPYYQLHVLILSLINIMFAISVDLTLGRVGQPNFGQAAFLGMGAYTSSILTLKLGWGFLPAFLVAVIISLASGYLIGIIAFRMRFFYFCIVTIAVAQVLLLTATNLIGLTGGPMGLTQIPQPVFAVCGWTVEIDSLVRYWYLGVLLVVLMLAVVGRLERSKVGRAWVGMRESESLASAVGINTVGYALLAYVLGAGFAGAAGSFYAHYVCFVDPVIFAFTWSSMGVVAAVLGGKGTIWGPVIGGILITVLPEFLRVASIWRLPLFGALLIAMVVFLPDGLVSLPRRIKEWQASQVRQSTATAVADKRRGLRRGHSS